MIGQDRTGALKNRNLELFWLDSATDAFFLHIQGSGRIRLRDGTVVRVGYAGTNGHRYTAIGRELIARGLYQATKCRCKLSAPGSKKIQPKGCV